MNNDVVQASLDFCAQLRGNQLHQLFNYLPGVYFVAKSRDGRTMMANGMAARLCGLDDESDMIGKTDYDLFSPERADTYVKDDQHVFETGKSIIDRVELAPDPNNSINWFVTTKIPLYSTDGKIIGLACMARNMDNTHEKLRPFVEMNEVLEYVRENYARPIKTADMARLVHLSQSQFERRFKKVFQITPTRHIQTVRIRAACNLLTATHDTIASIAQDSGFYDHSHFTRSFKNEMGVSPSEYRNKGQNTPW